jgi:D-aminopeptidase
VPRETRKMVYRMKILLDQRLDPLYEAVIEATEEAILNALCMARDMEGVNGNLVRALPLGEVKELVDRWQPPERGRRPDGPPLGRHGTGPRVRTTVAIAQPTAVRGGEGMPLPERSPAAPADPPGEEAPAAFPEAPGPRRDGGER